MVNGNQEVERVRQARCLLERMRGRLMHPTLDALGACTGDLDIAVDCLRQIDVSLKSPIWQGLARRKLEREVVALRAAMRSVEALLKNAARFYAGLARLMAPDEAPANYTAEGTTSAPTGRVTGGVLLHG